MLSHYAFSVKVQTISLFVYCLDTRSVGGVSPPPEVIPALSPNVTTASPVSESLNATVNSTNTADQGISANIVSQQSLASGKQPVLPDKPVTTTATMDPEQPQPHG